MRFLEGPRLFLSPEHRPTSGSMPGPPFDTEWLVAKYPTDYNESMMLGCLVSV